MSDTPTTKKRDRVVALVMAVLFFAFASSLTIAIIWESVASHNKTAANTSSNSSATSSSQSQAGSAMSGFTPTNNVPTLQSKDIKVGTGATAKAGDTVTVDYTGAVASTGIIFQTTQGNQPVSLSLNQVIKGWQLGIPGMKVGGTRQLLIPADEAYGATPPSGSGIPANAPLVFNVTLDKVGS